MQIRKRKKKKKKKNLKKKPKRHLLPLSRGYQKCKVQLTFRKKSL